jgi:hypothetical protein
LTYEDIEKSLDWLDQKCDDIITKIIVNPNRLNNFNYYIEEELNKIKKDMLIHDEYTKNFWSSRVVRSSTKIRPSFWWLLLSYYYKEHMNVTWLQTRLDKIQINLTTELSKKLIDKKIKTIEYLIDCIINHIDFDYIGNVKIFRTGSYKQPMLDDLMCSTNIPKLRKPMENYNWDWTRLALGVAVLVVAAAAAYVIIDNLKSPSTKNYPQKTSFFCRLILIWRGQQYSNIEKNITEKNITKEDLEMILLDAELTKVTFSESDHNSIFKNNNIEEIYDEGFALSIPINNIQANDLDHNGVTLNNSEQLAKEIFLLSPEKIKVQSVNIVIMDKFNFRTK